MSAGYHEVDSDNHDSLDEDDDDENLVAIMGTDLRGGVSWLEEECRDRSETKWITEARFVCSCSTWRIMVRMKSYTSSSYNSKPVSAGLNKSL